MSGGKSNVIVHLLEYRVVPGHEAEVTGYLRHSAPTATPSNGPAARFVGRRLSNRGREHLAATIWRDQAAFARGTDAKGLPTYLAPESSLLCDRASGRYRLVASTGLDRAGGRVLRLYRTSVAPHEIQTWERRVLEPMDRLADMEGVLTVVAGVEIEAGRVGRRARATNVVVLTVWSAWDPLLAATGGHLDRSLLGTDLSDLERPGTADHFELLQPEPIAGPEIAVGVPGRP
jgi:hypothetical protein